MTAAEVISLAFTRDLSEQHIKDTDIVTSRKMYVDAYITDAPVSGTLFDEKIKPVIAYGVAVNIFERLATEITDRGVAEFITQGARSASPEGKRLTKLEYQRTLNELIDLMCAEAEAEGLTVEDYDTGHVQFVGAQTLGRL